MMWGQRILNSGDEVWDATVNGSANRRVRRGSDAAPHRAVNDTYRKRPKRRAKNGQVHWLRF